MSDATEKSEPPKAQTYTVLELVKLTTQHFQKNKVESPRLEAELLLAHVLGVERIQLYVRFDQPLRDSEVAAFRELVKRRSRFEPAHYILGRREFWSLDLAVERGVLIPRPETECLVEEVLRWHEARVPAAAGSDVRSGALLAEVGVGSGAIAIALTHEIPDLTIIAGDIAEVPLRVAADNAKRHGVDGRVTIVRGSLLAPLAAVAGRPFDAVVSNPPYITEDDFAGLERNVRDWEPREALVGGVDGLDVIRALIAELPAALAEGGACFVEIGSDQGEAARKLFAACFAEVRVRKDYAGLDRVIVAVGYRR